MLIGAHESIAGGLSRAFERAVAHGGRSLQIFTKSARGWASPPLSDDERKAFRAKARETGLPAIAHGSYLANLASADAVVRNRSIDCVVDELTRCERLGIRYLVLHPGANPDEEKGLALVARAIDEVHERCTRFRARLCLEVTAGQGSSLGHRFEQLADILSRVRREDRLAFCLDTCHLFAAGYDLSTEAGYAAVMERFDRVVGLGRVRCLHLNDCRKPLGCRVDRHEEIGKGTIGLTAFRCLVNDERFRDAIAVLETPRAERYGRAIRLLESLSSSQEPGR